MKERNKSIFRILLFASVGILLAQTVLLAVLGNDRQMRIVLPLVFFFVELATCALMVFCTLNPQHNYNYTVKRVDGRWRWERITYGPDPDGWRYVEAGLMVLIIALLFVAIVAAMLWPQVIGDTVMTIIVIVLVAALCINVCVIEGRLRK